ncbi:hypothetical protein CHH28_09745 [Bacterioplanes sanyensis]|uniref:Copper chaperone PCu(A)C n=1 Tax=Bacterioplanes sanyensis TaxID=1249553 RepID=A0A222FK35_9GAMM|nr:copper chaperone PCu(A)C [Bacterioplanes sanyensis]ASP38946.1 hypothetical protein CHH28_09745 [Bacterioplanes sanyensis]
MRWSVLLGAVFCSASWACDVAIDGAYVREPIPGRHMSAGFMTVKNVGDKDLALVSARADWAGAIELHTHTHEDGVMRMRQVSSIAIPAGGEQRLESGGYHLMLMQLTLPLPEQPMMTLCFDNDHCVDQAFEIRSMR